MEKKDNNKVYKLQVELILQGKHEQTLQVIISEENFYKALEAIQRDPHINKKPTPDYIEHAIESGILYMYPDEYQRYVNSQVDKQIQDLFKA